MSNIAKSNDDKIFGKNFVIATICFTIAFFGLGYVLTILPEIATEQVKSLSTISGLKKYRIVGWASPTTAKFYLIY